MTAQEAFDAASKGGSNDLAVVLALCRRHGGYCVIGGLAVNTYVRPVFTMDADIVIAADKLPLVRADLCAAGFEVEDEEWSLNAQMPGSASSSRRTSAISSFPRRPWSRKCWAAMPWSLPCVTW
jgi:hypothetical protein